VPTKDGGTKTFLESIQAFNTPGKMTNFKYSESENPEPRCGLAVLKEVNALQGIVGDLETLPLTWHRLRHISRIRMHGSAQ